MILWAESEIMGSDLKYGSDEVRHIDVAILYGQGMERQAQHIAQKLWADVQQRRESFQEQISR